MEPSIRVRNTLLWKYRDANGSLYFGMMMCIVAGIQPPKRLASGQKKRIFKTLMLEMEKIVCRLKTKEFLWEVFHSKCRMTKLDSCVKVSGNWNLSTSSKTRKALEWTKATHSLSTRMTERQKKQSKHLTSLRLKTNDWRYSVLQKVYNDQQTSKLIKPSLTISNSQRDNTAQPQVEWCNF